VSYEPRIGDYGIVKTTGFFGFLIRLGTLSRWNHAFIYIGNDSIIEANPGGIQRSHVGKYSRIAWNKHEQLTMRQRKEIVQFAEKAIGTPYNFLMIGNLALRILGLKIFAKTTLLYRWAQKSKGYICSELCAEAYASAGVKIQQPDLATPGDLAERVIYL
jgi:uncharacterized protein YycO